jgi:hypothetical protein
MADAQAIEIGVGQAASVPRIPETIMATAPPTEPLNLDESRRRVVHPLQRLRGYIRTYVVLEGAAKLVLYVALCFWIGLLIDFGFFKVFGVDWVQVLPWQVRAIVLVVLSLGILLLVGNTLLRRFFREFSNGPLALVLERRFPGELGDRLITAVELADPRSAERFGFSRMMIDQTILDAAERVDRLPVQDVFNWRRLRRAGLWVAVLTVALYVLVGIGYCAIRRESPSEFFVRFGNTASIWFERNILLQETIWPRRAYLEVLNFPESGELKIGRNAPPPALRVRAVKWVVADAKAPEGWRAMTWADLRPEFTGGDPPTDLPGDWRSWTMDRIETQLDRAETQNVLSADLIIGLRSLFARMEERAASPNWERRFRRLEIPAVVMVYYRGDTVRSEQSLKRQEDNDYAGILSDLKESIRFTANGEDYYTPYKRIVVVPPPMLIELLRDEEQPAYLYHRAASGQPSASLRGLKHYFRDVPASLSGATSRIDIPAGTNLVLRGKTDKSLVMTNGVRLRPRENGPAIKQIARQIDDHAFEVRFDNLTAPLEFEFEFTDTDGVISRRGVSIKPVEDSPPDVDVQVEVIRKTSQGYMATVSAKIPFSGKVRDDHGLNSLEYAYTLTGLDVQSATLAKPIVAAFHLISGHAGAAFLAPGFLTWVGTTTRETAEETNRKPRIAGVATFERRLHDSAQDLTPAELQKSLREKPSQVLLRDHTFDPDEESFDAEKLNLKITDERQVQPRYRLRLWVIATDNNVETGPGVGEAHEKFTIYLVSENELLLEIAPVEEALHVKLDDAVTKLKDGRNKLELVIQEMPGLKAQEFSPMARRTEEVQETIVKTWDVAREVSVDYHNILKELRTNRVNPKIIEKVEKTICEPLDAVINQEFVRADESVQAFTKTLDDKKVDNQAAGQAREQVDKLLEKLQTILDAMRDITTINDLIRQLERMKAEEIQATAKFKELKSRLEDDILSKGLDKQLP